MAAKKKKRRTVRTSTRAVGKTKSSARAGGKSGPKQSDATWTLANVRDPLSTKTKLGARERRQLERLLADEGMGSVADARRDEEITLQLVDVVAGGKTLYRLFLWPFGSAALFAVDGRTPIGGAEQHAFSLESGDEATRSALARAWKASARSLGLRERLDFDASPRKRAPARAAAAKSLPDELAEIRALAKSNRMQALERCFALKLLPATWQVYPKWLPEQLSVEQRALIETMLDANLRLEKTNSGLFSRQEDWRRFLGHSRPGPSDTRIPLGSKQVPIWWAVAQVGSGQAKSAEVSAAWCKLPERQGLAAFTEVATGRAYDVVVAHATSFKDAQISGKPYQKAYRQRVVELLADVSVGYGDAGEKAAKALAKSLPDFGHAAQAFVAISSGIRHAKRRNVALEASWSRAFAELWKRINADAFHCDGLVTAIEKALPSDRVAEFRAGLKS